MVNSGQHTNKPGHSPALTHTYRRGGGGGVDSVPSQIRGGKFRCGKFRGAPWIWCITPRQSPQSAPLVCEKFAENPEFCVGNFAVNLKREISHAKLKCHDIPPPPPPCTRVCRPRSTMPGGDAGHSPIRAFQRHTQGTGKAPGGGRS